MEPVVVWPHVKVFSKVAPTGYGERIKEELDRRRSRKTEVRNKLYQLNQGKVKGLCCEVIYRIE